MEIRRTGLERTHLTWICRRQSTSGNLVTAFCYNSYMTHDSPAKRPTQRQCRWCADFFAVPFRPGRPKLYCRVSCRQRAYERRRGLGVLPPSDRLAMVDGGPLVHLANNRPGYERGIVAAGDSKSHALRLAGMSERGDRRITLCGVLARPTPRPFWAAESAACRTCAAVEHRRPSARAIRPSADLAAMRALLDDVSAELSRSPNPPQRTTLALLQRLAAAA